MTDKPGSFDFRHIDVLCEIGNIGAGNAATALSGMLGRRIGMSVPKIDVVPLSDIPGLCGDPGNPVVGGIVEMSGDLTGRIMIILDMKEARMMADLICHFGAERQGSDTLSELDMSALSEVMNILAGSYLSAISSMTGFVILPSIPYMCADMAGALLSVVAIEYGKTGDSALFFETRFLDDKDGIECSFFLLPDEASYGQLMKSLGGAML